MEYQSLRLLLLTATDRPSEADNNFFFHFSVHPIFGPLRMPERGPSAHLKIRDDMNREIVGLVGLVAKKFTYAAQFTEPR